MYKETSWYGMYNVDAAAACTCLCSTLLETGIEGKSQVLAW